MLKLIKKLNVPKVLLRYIMIKFLDLNTIENIILTIKEMNVLDNYSKDFLLKSKKGFSWNCKNGHLNVAQWLYSLGGVNIHADNEYAFGCSCENGHINVAQWLYWLGTNSSHPTCPLGTRHSLGNINIHDNYEAVFRQLEKIYTIQTNYINWIYIAASIIPLF